MTNGGAIIVVKAIAAGCTASIAVDAACYIDICAKSIAGSCRPVEGVGGAIVGVVACGRTISVADFICLYHAITATRGAVGIVVISAPARTTSIAVCASGDISETTSGIATL